MVVFNANLPGVSFPAYEHTVLQHPLPLPSGWMSGELHCHSNVSCDQVEFGAPPPILQSAATTMGLDFVCVTDHSFDFNYDSKAYMSSVSSQNQWATHQKNNFRLNELPGKSLMIPSEEVSCANSRGNNVHLLVVGAESYIPGLGDGGRRWFNNKPDLTIEEVIQRAGAAPVFAAHPKLDMGIAEKILLRRGHWYHEDIHHEGDSACLNGIQFWNGNRGIDFKLGRAFWVQQLLRGIQISPAAGNDAHGSLNFHTGVGIPLLKLYGNRTHLFGKVRTVVKSDNRNIDSIKTALKQNTHFCSDGPSLLLDYQMTRMQVIGISSPDFGWVNRIHIFGGSTGNQKESLIKSLKFDKDAYETSSQVPIPYSADYVRAELWTSTNKLAISSPIFL